MDTLVEESLGLRARYDEEPSHSDHVAFLALQMFDGLQAWHKMGPRSRELIHSAALLHDIGWSQTPDGKGHNKWSAKLIHAHPWKNLTKDEVAIVAQVARYHRKAAPQLDHEEFHALRPAAQKAVMNLGGILRIADALDRTHTSRIGGVEIFVKKNTITVRAKPKGNWNAERAMFETKRDMLQMAAERAVECEEIS